MTDRDIPDLTPSIRALLELEGKRGGPAASGKIRARARITAAIAADGAPTAPSGGGTAGVAGGASIIKGVLAATTVKVGVAFVVGLGLGSAVTASIRRQAPVDIPSVTAAASTATTTSTMVPSATAAPTMSETPTLNERGKTGAFHSAPRVPTSMASPLAAPTLAPPREYPGVDAPQVVAGSPSSHAGVDRSLADERRILEDARSALARRDTFAAIAAAQQHETRFPRGQLGAEREAILIQALAMANRRAEAIERAARFRVAYPNSVLTSVVDQAVERGKEK